MTTNEIREKFLKFFEQEGHKIISSSSLIPENDLSVLFTTAGMQQFKPYYLNPELAEKDFGTKNVVTVQKCVRTGDIDEVGDNTHLTFFEMLGNFSFGGYGRKEAIEYAYEFITKEMSLKISYVTIFKGLGAVEKDKESEKIWQSLGVTNIREEGMEDLFWGPTGNSGPCGPTTEIYCKNASGEDVEIWNIVFNEYFCDSSREKLDKGEAKLTRLPILGVDTGMGLERLVSIVQKKESVYSIDIFEPIIDLLSENLFEKDKRIITDHIKTSAFMVSDGVKPSSKSGESGSVLRNLITKIFAKYIDVNFEEIIKIIIKLYQESYSELDLELILGVFKNEKPRYMASFGATGKAIDKRGATGPVGPLTGLEVFNISSTLGTRPSDVIKIAIERGISPSPAIEEELENAIKEHQEISRIGAEQKFKGGLVNHNEKAIKLHTAHHLLLTALQLIVNPDIKQRGSNITEERLRMDFTCDHKLTDEEKQKIENWVNDKIRRDLSVVHREMPLAEAGKIGAQMEFGAKYPKIVSIYFIEDENGFPISKEFCGGPHVAKTSELGHFKIQKEEAVSAGVRRIKAILK